MDPVRQIKLFNSGRDPERLTIKYSKMRASAFAFLRGTCHLFYDRLPREGMSKNFPLVWACGDLHLENFGTYKGDNRLVYFDLNDFDEAALAPASWDLVRMLTSIWVGTESSSTKTSDSNILCLAFLDAYSSVLAAGKSYWVERETAQGPVRALLDSLRQRSRLQFLEARTELKGKKRIIRVDSKKALASSKIQRTNVMECYRQTSLRRPINAIRGVVRSHSGALSSGL